MSRFSVKSQGELWKVIYLEDHVSCVTVMCTDKFNSFQIDITGYCHSLIFDVLNLIFTLCSKVFLRKMANLCKMPFYQEIGLKSVS